MVSRQEVRGRSTGVLEKRASIYPLLEAGEARYQKCEGTGDPPRSKDDQQIKGIAKLCQCHANILDA
jgi:hypothetical protein